MRRTRGVGLQAGEVSFGAVELPPASVRGVKHALKGVARGVYSGDWLGPVAQREFTPTLSDPLNSRYR